MSIAGMYMLNTSEYEEEKIHQALDMLYVDRKNEFRELSQVLLSEKAITCCHKRICFECLTGKNLSSFLNFY